MTFANTPSVENIKSRQANEHFAFPIYSSFQEAIQAVPTLQPKGLTIKVRAASSRSFSTGSPVLYKHIEVGEVIGVQLAENNNDIILDLFIDENYSHLLKTTSKFYNSSGITLEGGLDGLEVKTASVKSILKGGISFFTPAEGQQAQNDTPFILYEDYNSALDADKTKIFLHFAKPNGLKKIPKLNIKASRLVK